MQRQNVNLAFDDVDVATGVSNGLNRIIQVAQVADGLI